MGGIGTDLANAARSLLRRPASSALAVGILAVGIGSATAAFSLVEAALFRALPFPDAERLVAVSSTIRDQMNVSVSYPDFRDFRASGAFDDAAVFQRTTLALADADGEPERIAVAQVEEGFFEVLGAGALGGRLLAGDDFGADAPTRVVLSEGIWRRRFAGDLSVVGTDIRLDGLPYTVVGVLRADHAWPLGAEAWIAYRWGAEPPPVFQRRTNHTFSGVARLAPGITPALATARLEEVALRIATSEPDGEAGWGARVRLLHDQALGDDGRLAMKLVAAMVTGVLLIACFNVAGLLLVQSTGRVRDLSVRAALGAGRVRLLRQLLAESALLALVGGALGTGLGILLVRLGLRGAPAAFGRLSAPELDGRVLLLALATSVAAALIAGLAPAWRASRTHVADALRESTRVASPGRRRRSLQVGFVVAQLALSTVLLLGAGLMLRAVSAALTRDPGFDDRGLLTFVVGLPAGRYGEREAASAFFHRALEEIEALPGVTGVTLSARIPAGGRGLDLIRSFLPEGAAEPPAGPDHAARWIEVEPGFFETLAVPVVEGRPFRSDDDAGSEPVMIVSETLARAWAPEGSAVGLRVRSWRDENVYRRVVGVAAAVPMEQGGEESFPVVWIPREQSTRRTMAFFVRSAGDPLAQVTALREVMRRLDPDVAIEGVATMDEVRRAAIAPERYLSGLLGVFGVMALGLAAAGVYGLVAFSVAARTREIGIRVALGASRRSVQGLVLREGTLVTLLGVALGSAGALGLARTLRSLLLGVGWLDGAAWGAVLGTLVLTALLATCVPALRASRVDPVRALRSD